MKNIENGIQTFYFENKQIKIKVIDNEPCFHLEDVCRILEIEKPEKAKERLLDKQGIYDVITFTLTGYKETNFISETNLYRLIFKLHRRENIEFAVWITSEVLPIFIRDKVAKKLIKDIEELRTNDLEKLRERNSFK
ncbi:MAG: BRO family protein [Lactobacillus iners]|nr:BRO family protein [Lactobacillus iners]